MEFIDFAAIAGAAAASTVAAVLWILKNQSRSAQQPSQTAVESERSISFLFENDSLHHASDTAARLFQLIPGRDDWTGLREKLMTRFPNLPETPEDATPGETAISAHDAEDSATLFLTRDGAYTRLNMLEDGENTVGQSERIKALQRKLDDLKRASDTTSHAIWQVDSKGLVMWHNAAYATLYRKLHQSEPNERMPVFDLLSEFDEKTGRRRVSAEARGNEGQDWYDVNAVSVGDVTIYHAVDVNAVVKSEVAQRNFVQTLAKTFAQLSIGLAIFDRNGQLALFNPALIDLTDLPADFLSSRPTLMSFFDRIRENRRMPEPKNYQSWRQQITDVIAAATDGRYQETWTLETGQTYRVNGRPHPDGAIAFLIEDITAEISLTRNFRAELELGQSLMDTFEEALVVFSSTGVLTFCNLAYRQMWGADPNNSFADVTIADCTSDWKAQCAPGTNWSELEDFVLDFGEASSWEMIATLNSGGALRCVISRIASGATILRFFKTETPVASLPIRETATGTD